ncbi:MAG: hypothetical protein ACJ8OJ_08110 [Povalibacter sp.]
MLPVRLGVVTAIAALCLWGLFSLLDSLQEPGLLRTAKATAIKGCDTIESEQAKRECPALFCEKTLLDSKRVPIAARFEVTLNRSAEGATLIGGAATSKGQPPSYFLCELQGGKVTRGELVERSVLENL